MSTHPGPLAVVPAFKTTVEGDGSTGGGVGRGVGRCVVGAGGVGVKIKTGGGVGGGVIGGEVSNESSRHSRTLQ